MLLRGPSWGPARRSPLRAPVSGPPTQRGTAAARRRSSRHSNQQRPQRRAVMPRAAPDVFVFDFDGCGGRVARPSHSRALPATPGAAAPSYSAPRRATPPVCHPHQPQLLTLIPSVLVDSEPEVSMSAYTAARDYWPSAFDRATSEQRAAVLRVRSPTARLGLGGRPGGGECWGGVGRLGGGSHHHLMPCPLPAHPFPLYPRPRPRACASADRP